MIEKDFLAKHTREHHIYIFRINSN
jgi:hypothetical protein